MDIYVNIGDDPNPTPMVKIPLRFVLLLGVFLSGCRTQETRGEAGAQTSEKSAVTKDAEEAKAKAQDAKAKAEAQAARVKELLEKLKTATDPAEKKALETELAKAQAELAGGSVAGLASAASGECSFKTGAACQAKCDSGDQKACLWLGISLAKTADRDVAQRERAITILEKACGAKVQRACVHVALQKKALVLKKYKRVPNAEEKTEAAVMMAKACEANDGVACNSAARNLKEGYGVEKDDAKAKVLREKALKLMAKECEASDPESCLALGILYMGGKAKVVEPDIEKAKKYLETACKLGEEAGCKGVPEGWPAGE